MKILNVFLLFTILLTACSTAAPTSSATDAPATSAPTAAATIEPTATLAPTPTPIPGLETVPLADMAAGIPWLPFHEIRDSAVTYYGFNMQRAPFDNVLVRKAFAAAFDHEAFFEYANSYLEKYAFYPDSYTLATTLTPPDIFGRDLTGEIGIPFDPEQARRYLAEAGYEDPSTFPPITMRISYGGFRAPAISELMAKFAVAMWEENLGISSIDLKAITSGYNDAIKRTTPDIFSFGWAADYSDPDNFLNELFHSDNEFNLGGFSNAEFDRLVEEAAALMDPAERQLLYILAERLLCEEEVGAIPLFHWKVNY